MAPSERRSPGLAALFGALEQDGSHSLLELGEATGRHLRVLGRFARQMRFAGLLASVGRGAEWHEALWSLQPHPARPYDVVLLWDVLDRLDPEERSALVERLAEVTAPGARLHAIAGRADDAAAGWLAFTFLDVDRISERPGGDPGVGRGALLPAEMERVLAPFEVVHAFILRTGAREYVAMKSS